MDATARNWPLDLGELGGAHGVDAPWWVLEWRGFSGRLRRLGLAFSPDLAFLANMFHVEHSTGSTFGGSTDSLVFRFGYVFAS